jgi:hypothetical protein
MIGKIWKKIGKIYEEYWRKYGRNSSWIVIRYGQYGRKASWIEKRFGKYRRKVSWIVKRFGKYRRTLWNDRENVEENTEKIWTILTKIVKRDGKYGRK